MFTHPSFDAHEAVHHFFDAATGLKAIIAVHSTRLGPAAGGCRMWPYADDNEALDDVLRLAKGMSYKNAMAGLPLGGGKAVIIGDAAADKTPQLMRAFGRAVETMAGRYITAEDVGMSVADMEHVATQTRFVAGLANGASASGDPSPLTAHGVYLGLRAAVSHRLGIDSLKGVRVAVQGLGNVGYNLCRELHGAGAQLIVTDISLPAVERAVGDFGAEAVAPDAILASDVDVLAPCALGSILTAASVPRIKARVIAGAANNQLADDSVANDLGSAGILYAPDYVINAGGIMNVAMEVTGEAYSRDVIYTRVSEIGETLATIFKHADREGRSTLAVANQMAEVILTGPEPTGTPKAA